MYGRAGSRAVSEELSQFSIRLWKRKLAEIATRNPLQLLSQQWLWLARDRRVAEVQTYRAFRVDVLGNEELGADRRVHAELFSELTREADVMRLAWLAFATRKFPEAGQVSAVQATGDEQMTIAFDDRGDDDHG